MVAPDPSRVSLASKRFASFFEELKQTFVEREDLLAQIALSLLAKEHVLMTGPPGTAKSQVASAVLRRIIDERTGLPSLYARQFTESTVQTDLVGPIDFKTLMDTGRTEHFTDQGILGAVHAFLDEVFDGRDMLLRSALNVLQERELKEGTKTTRGQIECAIMTSNRYLAEVLEGSRDTLLAFVDRIAFVCFMPRGFAEPKNLATVLRRHVAGVGGAPLIQPLTVQDLDALQAVVDSVHVSEAACDAIASFLENLELELSAAAKADPAFIPTRYVSTRTAVRCGRVLRAIVVFRRIFLEPERPLEVLPDDFALLRLHLLLSGPSREALDRLLARETDPRERRQLSILRTEREAFERCLSKVPRFQPSPRLPSPEVAALERAAAAALGTADPDKLVSSVRALTPLSLAGGPSAERAAVLVKQMADTLAARAVRTGLAAMHDQGDEQLSAVAMELGELARQLDESARPEARDAVALARWLRGRALAVLDEAIAFDPGAKAGDVGAALKAGSAGDVGSRIARRIGKLEALIELRRRLEAQGAEGASNAPVLEAAHEHLEEDVAALLDADFRRSIEAVLDGPSRKDIDAIVAGLGGELSSLDALAQRIGALFGGRSRLKERVVGPRLGSLIATLVLGLDGRDREGLVARIDALRGTLESNGLGQAVSPEQWLEWSTGALVRVDRPQGGALARTAPSYAAYRTLRSGEVRTPIAVTLREIALRVAPPAAGSAEQAEQALRDVLGRVSHALRTEAAEVDFSRIERALELLETWWWALAGGPQAQNRPLDQAEERLKAIVASRYLEVVLDEATLLRFSLEARLVAETFPAQAERADKVRARIDELRRSVRTHVVSLGRSAGDQAWSEVLAKNAS